MALSFLAPVYLLAAGAAAAAIIAAHFIVRRHPRALVFPTARFVPQAPVLTAGLARRPSDLALLALRVLCVVLTGAALAGPVIAGPTRDRARVILVDRSRAVADSGEVRDSVARVRQPGDVVIELGGQQRRAAAEAGGGAAAASTARGSLSAGLVAAVRAASRFRDRADSVELVIVSALAREQLDAAAARVRAEWPGRARLIPVAIAQTPPRMRAPELVTGGDDPIAAALTLAAPLTSSETRIVRAALSAADSAWVAAGAGRVLVHWPISTSPHGFSARDTAAPIAGLTTESQTIVAPFARAWSYVAIPGTRPVAFWSDGEAAAAEATHGAGCIRSVAVPVAAAGDLVLRQQFHRVVRDMLDRCGGAAAYDRLPSGVLAMLTGPPQLASARAFSAPSAAASDATKWLLLAALACLLLETLLRRRTRAASDDQVAATAAEPGKKAA